MTICLLVANVSVKNLCVIIVITRPDSGCMEITLNTDTYCYVACTLYALKLLTANWTMTFCFILGDLLPKMEQLV